MTEMGREAAREGQNAPLTQMLTRDIAAGFSGG